MELKTATLLAAALVATNTLSAKTIFEENFMQYPDYAPRMAPDKGIRCGTDPIWQGMGQVDVNVKAPCDLFRENIAVPEGSFNATFRFKLNAKQPKTEKNKETGEVKVVEPGDPSFFDLAFFDKDGKRETVRIASDKIAKEPVDFLDNGWKNFGLKVRGTGVELWMATDRGHEFGKVTSATLQRKPAAFNFGCTPEKKFSMTVLFVKTADEPLMSFPVEKHFASFKSLSQPLANAKVAQGGEEIDLGGGRRAGVAFSFGGNASRTAQIGFNKDDGTSVAWDCAIGDYQATGRKDAFLSFRNANGGRLAPQSQWVRPNMRPFCENSESGQRGMVDSGFDILREWDKLPPASKHNFNIDFTHEANGSWTMWVDGSRALSLGDGIKNFFFKPGAGVAYTVKGDDAFAKIDRSRFEPLDFAANPRAKTMANGALKGIQPGVRDFGGAPVKLVAPIDSADISICRQGKGNWALEVEEYHGRHPHQGFPMAVHYRVPAATYVKAHILFAIDPDPKKDAILTLRLGQYETNGVGGNRLGDVVLDFTDGVPDWCKKVGEVEFNGKTAPLYFAAVALNVGPVIDQAARTDSYMEFDLTGKGWENFQQIDNRMKPDPNSDSAFNLFGVTLEKAPFSVTVREAQPGNIFTADEGGKKTAFDIITTKTASGSVKWVAKDIDGVEAFKGEAKWSGAAGSTNRVDIPFGNVGPGWYSLDVTFADEKGKDLFTHEAALGIMPPAGRKVSRKDSPYAVWWFNTHGSTGAADIGGPIMKKAGIRKFSWNSFSKTVKDENGRSRTVMDQDMYDKYDTTGCGNFHVPGRRDNFDPDKGVFLDKTDKKTGAITKGEDWFVHEVRKSIDRMPKDSVPTPMIWHESAPGSGIAEELIGREVPTTPSYPMAEADAKYINECARLLRKHFPELAPRLQIGNSTWSHGAVVHPLRNGAKAESYGRVGIETPSQTIVPEKLQDCNIQGQHATMDAFEAISGKTVKCNGSWEFVYRTERDLGIRTQAEYYIRDILISLAHDYYLISPGIFFDCSSGYYNGLWGGSGLTYRSPWVYPKPAIVAYGVLTKALDGVKFSRQIDTGSTTVYAIEFKRIDGKYATALWASRGAVEFAVSSPSGGTVVQMLGKESPLKKGDSTVKAGSSPVYVITDKPLASATAGARTYPKAEKIVEKAVVVAEMDDSDEIELVPDPWLATAHRFLPHLEPCDEFTVRNVKDPEKGHCVELALGPAKEPPKNKFIDRYVTRYTTMRFKEPKPIAGKPNVIGVWVKGDSNWGQVRFEIEDAQGEVFKNLSSGSWWCCDIMDWPGNLCVNFDGWAYVYCPLRDTTLISERSPGPVVEQWSSEGGDKVIDFPIKLRAVSVGMNRSKLDLVDFKPASNVLRFKDVGVTAD
ncbi:MAG: hypothetical protein IJT64_04280 [Kiritimatiellae bacterium]|nr:hypothetical protein [Kiritimatiellia bacterium]